MKGKNITKNTAHNSSQPLLSAPVEIHQRILGFATGHVLSDANIATDNNLVHTVGVLLAFSSVCRSTRGNAQDRLLKAQSILKEKATQLLTHVVHGEDAEAMEMVKANPDLLFMKATALEHAAGIGIDGKPSPRLIENRSPYQAALGAGNIWLLKAMEACFKDGHHQIALKQFNQQFPDGKFDYPPSTFDFHALIDVINSDQTLRDSNKPSLKSIVAIAHLRNHFNIKQGDTREGHHFNMKELISAIEAYGNYGGPDRNPHVDSFIWCKVVGSLQRLVSAIDARALCSQNLDAIAYAEQVKGPEESFEFYNWVTDDKSHYYPPSSLPGQVLGEDIGLQNFGYGAQGPHRGAAGVGRTALAWALIGRVENLCRVKTYWLKEFKQRLQNPGPRIKIRP